jgi:signal-transduction protein with cAMP-binding, CBS, and nucleotidyltransferase domain/PAS domain-containing protein
MSGKSLYKFFVSIVLPSILAILLFIVTFFVVIIPQFEKNLLNAKKETIKELTQSAWSVLEEHRQEVEDSLLTLENAQQKAAHQIEKMRYGQNRKDYFWITDMRPFMVMHPYRAELMGDDLSNYEDSHGNKLFLEAVEVVRTKADGFINYYWQWKDDTTRVVPKLSYVIGFEPWGWIIGTGIYLEDVRAEIAYLKNRLLLISAGIVLIIILIWVYVIRQSLRIENRRRAAEQNLRQSRLKYKSLVEASTDGTLMMVNDEIIYHNLKFKSLLEYSVNDVVNLVFDDLFSIKWELVKTNIKQPDKSYSFETKLIVSAKCSKDVVLTISKVDYSGAEGYIVIVKDVSTDKQISKESQELSRELQLPMLNMSKPITGNIQSLFTVTYETPVQEVAKIMKRHNATSVFVTAGGQIVGIITEKNIPDRVVADGKDISTPASEIMTAPVLSIENSAPLYKAVIMSWKNNATHLLVKNEDGEAIGVVGRSELLEFQQNSLGFLSKEIYAAETIPDLVKLHKRVPILVKALLDSGSKASNITYVNSFVADAIHQRVVELAIEKLGEPPVEFCFMVMGSEGRMEETLYTDQDNAIIFEDKTTDTEYFHKLSYQITEDLHRIGYNRCKGDIMASNKKWCKPLSEWKKYFTDWTQTPDPQNVLDSSIFFDFRCVYGNMQLPEMLHYHLKNLLPKNGLFFYHMSQSLNRFKPSLNSETVDMKKLLFPLVGAIRVYSLHYGLSVTNTISRLTKLTEKTERIDAKELRFIYDFLTRKRLEIQTNAIMNHEPPDNMLDLTTLTIGEHKLLEHAITKINELLSGLNMDFARQ